MTRKYVGPGETLLYTNAGPAIASGAVVTLGATAGQRASIGIALGDIAATTGTGEVGITGVYEIAKVDAAVIVAGETVFWDVSALAVDDNSATAATGDVANCGIAMESKGVTSGATIKVKLLPGNGNLTA